MSTQVLYFTIFLQPVCPVDIYYNFNIHLITEHIDKCIQAFHNGPLGFSITLCELVTYLIGCDSCRSMIFILTKHRHGNISDNQS